MEKTILVKKAILDFLNYLSSSFDAFIQERKIFILWNPFLNFLERFRKYMSDDSFKIVRLIIIAVSLILIILLFRLIYCKYFLEENFKSEFTYLKDFFHPDAFLLAECGLGIEFDAGTISFVLISIGCLVSIALTFIGILVYSRYLVVSICLFIISALIMLIIIKSNINIFGLIRGIIFTLAYTSFIIVANVAYIASIICFYFLLIFFHICILMIMSIPVFANLAKESDVFKNYGTTFHDYHNNQREDYKCEGKDAFGNIILKDKDGNEILARKDKNGNIKRLDNYKHLD